MLEKKYYDGVQIHRIVCEEVKDNDTIMKILKRFADEPSALQESLSDAYVKSVYEWLLNYQVKAGELLKGRYAPYEVLSWVANDWRKEHERSD